MTKLFVTATDTDAGKTLVSAALIHKLVNNEKTVAAFKPISAGCDEVAGQLVNEDALLLQQQANSHQTISQVNPIAFKEPIAPHIAASTTGTAISINDLDIAFNSLTQLKSDFILTEGAGGWRLPLGGGDYLSDFAINHKMDVVLVVNMKLGCLNHAILTYQAILNDGLKVVGWVANSPETMPYLSENISELEDIFDAPCIGRIGYVESIEQASESLSIDVLL